MTFDSVYKEIGDLGLFQKQVLLLGAFTDLWGGLFFMNSVFLLYVPDHRCAIPGYENDTYIVQNDNHRRLIQHTIPPSQESTGIYDSCNFYTPEGNGTTRLNRCSSWVYDTSVYPETIGTKMNLVCHRAIFKSSAQMAFFIGYFIGSITSGLISDRFGRKPTSVISIMVLSLVCLSIAWTPTIEVYIIQSAFLGCFYVSMFHAWYCNGMEWVGPPKRLYAGQLNVYFWIAGNLIMALFAYLIRDWSTFQLVCAAPGFIFWSYWLVYPESPRWLYIQRKIGEMKRLITKAAMVNKVSISDEFFETLPTPEKENSTAPFFRLFKYKPLACRLFVLYFLWFAVCLAYYALTLNSGSLGNTYGVHLYFFLQMLMDIPGCLLALILIDKLGRKSVTIGCTLIGGGACVVCAFTIVYGGQGGKIATLIFALLGKLAVAAGFKSIYQLSMEIFPTVARNAGFGSCSCIARIGGMVAPFVADLDGLVGGSFGKALPRLIIGVLSVTAGLLALLLPETLNKRLTETIREEIDEERRVLQGNRLNKQLAREPKPLKEPLEKQESGD